MKANLIQSHIVSAQSLGASFTSNAVPVPQADIVGLQLNYATGSSPVGSFQIQASLDHSQDQFGNVTNAGSWTALYLSVNGSLTNSIAIPSNTTPIFVDMSLGSAPYLRVVYTRTSGSTTLDVWLTYKRIGD